MTQRPSAGVPSLGFFVALRAPQNDIRCCRGGVEPAGQSTHAAPQASMAPLVFPLIAFVLHVGVEDTSQAMP